MFLYEVAGDGAGKGWKPLWHGLPGLLIRIVVTVQQLVFAQHAAELVIAQGQQLGGFALIILGLLQRLLE